MYTGKQLDPDTGFYYSNARWYNADLGRFITEDPIKDGLNWYVYCGSNPMVRIDPSGLDWDVSDLTAIKWTGPITDAALTPGIQKLYNTLPLLRYFGISLSQFTGTAKDNGLPIWNNNSFTFKGTGVLYGDGYDLNRLIPESNVETEEKSWL